MDTSGVVIAVLVGVLVGALLPVLVQLFLTLGRLRRVVGEAEETVRRVNRVGAGIEDSVLHARKLLDGLGEVGESISKINSVAQNIVNVGLSVGPAVVAGARAFVSSDGKDASENGNDAPAEAERS